VTFIIEGAAKMDQFVDELSSYSLALRIVPESFVLTPLGVMLRTVLAKMSKVLTNSEAEVTYTELPRVSGDPDRLMQLFENLLLNSLRGQVSPQIQIAAEPHEGGWLFAVRDNGPEMDEADLERMFQPFARSGSGLGLATCREIAERHGGRMWAESEPGAGCAVFFTLPG
jgi:signal transduction histidine kinase